MPRQINPIGLEKAAKYAREGVFDIWGDYSNQRKAHCKVCGNEIPKGEGIATYYYPMQIIGTPQGMRHYPKCKLRTGGDDCICGSRHQTVFVCPSCDEKIGEINSLHSSNKKEGEQ